MQFWNITGLSVQVLLALPIRPQSVSRRINPNQHNLPGRNAAT